MTTYSMPDFGTPFMERNDLDGIEYRNIKTIAGKNQAVKEALDQLMIVYELAKDPNDPDLEHYSGIEEDIIDIPVDYYKEDFNIFNEEDEQKIL